MEINLNFTYSYHPLFHVLFHIKFLNYTTTDFIFNSELIFQTYLCLSYLDIVAREKNEFSQKYRIHALALQTICIYNSPASFAPTSKLVSARSRGGFDGLHKHLILHPAADRVSSQWNRGQTSVVATLVSWLPFSRFSCLIRVPPRDPPSIIREKRLRRSTRGR